MNTTAFNSKNVEGYFSLLDNLNSNNKLDLIASLRHLNTQIQQKKSLKKLKTGRVFYCQIELF